MWKRECEKRCCVLCTDELNCWTFISPCVKVRKSWVWVSIVCIFFVFGVLIVAGVGSKHARTKACKLCSTCFVVGGEAPTLACSNRNREEKNTTRGFDPTSLLNWHCVAVVKIAGLWGRVRFGRTKDRHPSSHYPRFPGNFEFNQRLPQIVWCRDQDRVKKQNITTVSVSDLLSFVCVSVCPSCCSWLSWFPCHWFQSVVPRARIVRLMFSRRRSD